MVNQQQYKRQWIKFQITGRDRETGKFVDYLNTKLHKNFEVFSSLMKLLSQFDSIHRLRFNRSQDTEKIIGVLVQVNDKFDFDKYKKEMVNIHVGDNLYIPKKLDCKTDNEEQLSNLKELRYLIKSGQEILDHVYHKQVSESDNYRHTLRLGDTNNYRVRTYNHSRTEPKKEVRVLIRKRGKLYEA